MNEPNRSDALSGADSGSMDDVVQRHLDELGISYELINIDPAYADTASFCEKYGYSLEKSVNCIVVASKGPTRQYAACLVQATRRLDVNHTVRRLLGARRVSFASAEETMETTGMTPGGVTPFALPPDIPIYVDAPITALGEMILGGGGRSTKLIMSVDALAPLPNVTVVEGLALTPPE